LFLSKKTNVRLTTHATLRGCVQQRPSNGKQPETSLLSLEAYPMNSREKTIAGMIGLISLVPAWWTNAQESQGRVLDEITVTAQKRSESLMDVPIALTAFSGEALDNFGVGGTQDLQFSTPSIVYANTGAFAQPYIRGVGSRLLNNGFEPSVATYVDGRYISRQSAFMFDLADVERVEVLKGPQGVVFGRNASAGAIRLITKDVGEAFEGAVKVTAGNYDYRAVSGTVNIPISDTFGMRISGMTKDRDGYAQNLLSVGQSEWDNLNTEALRAKLRWDITERATANLTLGYWSRDDNDGNDTVALGPLQYHAGIIRGGITGRDVDEVATVVDWTNKITELSAELNIKIAFDGFDLTSITTRAEMDDNELSFEGDGTSTIAVDGLIFEETENYSQELQFTSNQDSSLNWLVGAYLYNDETLQDTTIDIGPLFLSQGLQTVETTAWAAFGQLRWQFNDYWALTLGGRYSHEEKDVKVVASQHVSFTVPAVPYSTDEE
jgi:iron complex outermembrane recepter protein